MRGGGENVAGGAVIAFEADDLGAGEVVLEAQDVVDLGAAPAVDRLVVVADAADVFRRGPWSRLGLALRDACRRNRAGRLLRVRVYSCTLLIQLPLTLSSR